MSSLPPKAPRLNQFGVDAVDGQPRTDAHGGGRRKCLALREDFDFLVFAFLIVERTTMQLRVRGTCARWLGLESVLDDVGGGSEGFVGLPRTMAERERRLPLGGFGGRRVLRACRRGDGSADFKSIEIFSRLFGQCVDHSRRRSRQYHRRSGFFADGDEDGQS